MTAPRAKATDPARHRAILAINWVSHFFMGPGTDRYPPHRRDRVPRAVALIVALAVIVPAEGTHHA